ncbi:MAG TPA: peptidoglycan editing factor PgeF [Hyphomicrobiaceae bacterium]|jgi:YfiH family protein|nr:peptidoglycan editing factor PgeF [Hyphomicrobiaceae bacterium]
MLDPLLAPRLAALPALRHGFFTRLGGVSRGLYAALNCGPGSRDDPAAVLQNRDRVQSHLGARALLSAYQVHGTVAIVASTAWPNGERPRADAIVTATPGIAVSALTADCAPVLFAEPVAGVVAAAHAGWRGALEGILEATVATMEELGAKRDNITAAIGPAIGPSAYEVGWEFQATFLERDPDSAAFFRLPEAGARPSFNLPGYVADRLRRLGVSRDLEPMPCTFAREDMLFSYRRSGRRGEGDYGRQISAIVLT